MNLFFVPSGTVENKNKKKRRTASPLPPGPDTDIFLMRTTPAEKKKIDNLVGRYIYATNSSFRTVSHPVFKKLVSHLRPGYVPPSRYSISDDILDYVHDEEYNLSKSRLQGKTVSMDLDGWSNIHNEPVLCASITTENGDSYLVKTIDSSGHPHDTNYLTEVANQCIREVSTDFGVKISSLVTDSAANMNAMRREWQKCHSCNSTFILTYGCSAHFANLFAKDLDIAEVCYHIVQIVKQVRYNHDAAA